jgi:hypothetical protein
MGKFLPIDGLLSARQMQKRRQNGDALMMI